MRTAPRPTAACLGQPLQAGPAAPETAIAPKSRELQEEPTLPATAEVGKPRRSHYAGTPAGCGLPIASGSAWGPLTMTSPSIGAAPSGPTMR